ncbi:hypothetical protein Taro_022138 [Colocasia esculenta]|uniref:Uncharacterized protein n=1 Tax=Colocasia esculenta TaxID=4460 RepID=A0A843V118_COLES|nr:hypothetical protein [Colocasia esculenta]
MQMGSPRSPRVSRISAPPCAAYYEKPVFTKGTSTYHHKVPPWNTNTTVPPRGHTITNQTTTSESMLTNHNNNRANTMAHING